MTNSPFLTPCIMFLLRLGHTVIGYPMQIGCICNYPSVRWSDGMFAVFLRQVLSNASIATTSYNKQGTRKHIAYFIIENFLNASNV